LCKIEIRATYRRQALPESTVCFENALGRAVSVVSNDRGN
jgi:hypothetical protein